MILYFHEVASAATKFVAFMITRNLRLPVSLSAAMLMGMMFCEAVAAPGDLDPTFNPNANFPLYTAVMQPDGKILIGGAFDRLGGIERDRIARLSVDGSIDMNFDPSANSPPVNTITVQADGKIVIGGGFTTVRGVPRNYIARLNADGTLDLGFNPDASSDVYCTVVQADGKILFGGHFGSVAGILRHGIARLDMNGKLDQAFNPNPNASVFSIAPQADGKVVIGGNFTKLGTIACNRIARLNDDGSVDPSFNPNSNESVRSVVVQADRKILIAGLFTNVCNLARNHIARLNEDGSLDVSFDPDANNPVDTIALQADGKIVIGGRFTVVGGTARNYVARLNADGTPDVGFDPDASFYVYSTAIQADGKIVMGGVFTSVSGAARSYIARLNNDVATQSLTASSTRVEWLRGGASPETQEVVFELSTDGGETWSFLGVGSRIPGGWERAGLNLPDRAQVRARARIIAGVSNGSSGLVQTVAAVPVSVQLIDMKWLANGSFQFGFTGRSGDAFTTLGTTDITLPLDRWTVLGLPQEISPGRFQFTDSTATEHLGRFYTVRSP